VYTVSGIQLAAGATLSIGTIVAFATTLTRVIRPVTALQNAGQGFSARWRCSSGSSRCWTCRPRSARPTTRPG